MHARPSVSTNSNRPSHDVVRSTSPPTNSPPNDRDIATGYGKDFSQTTITQFEQASNLPKLRIDPVDSPLEREANSVASAIMRTPSAISGMPSFPRSPQLHPKSHALHHTLSSTPIPLLTSAPDSISESQCVDSTVMRKPSTSFSPALRRQYCPSINEDVVHRAAISEGSRTVPAIVGLVISQPGQPLPDSSRKFFESRLGADLSRVRIHTNAQAAESAYAINARAYTVGNSIAFASGHFAPESEYGKGLLAHELVHVLQEDKNNHATSVRRQSWSNAQQGGASGVEQPAQAELSSLARQKLTDRQQINTGSEAQGDVTGPHSVRYAVSVSASGGGGIIESKTTVSLEYVPDRTVGVVGQPVVAINPELGLGPVKSRPAYPYTISYTRTIIYSDGDGRTVMVEVHGEVFASDTTIGSQHVESTPSFDTILALQGDSGFFTATLRGASSIAPYFASYSGRGNSIAIQSEGAVTGLGLRGGLTLIDVSQPAGFVAPKATAGEQYASLRAYLISADAAELARRLAQLVARQTAGSSWIGDMTQSLADLVAELISPFIEAVANVSEAIAGWWNELPPWAKGLLVSIGKFAAGLAAMAGVAALIVYGAGLAGVTLAFGAVMLALGVAALVFGFGMSVGSRLTEAWNSDNKWRVLLAPLIAILDTLGISGMIEAGTNESLLSGQSLKRTEAERWEGGFTGAFQLVGIFLMARGMSGGPRAQTVTPEVRGNLTDFHALPQERLPVLPEGHFWQRQGTEWTLFREPNAPEVPIEISIYSDGQGKINYNIRSGNRVLQSEAQTRSPDDTFPPGHEARLPPELSGTGENNPFGSYQKGHGIDYADRLEGPGVRSSNADPANFTPQAPYWNQYLRNQLVRGIRNRGGGYREMPLYEQGVASTVNGTPIPTHFIFVETSPTGNPVAAWRIPNDRAIDTRNMTDLQTYEISVSEIPRVMLGGSGRMIKPGTFISPLGSTISGARSNQEDN